MEDLERRSLEKLKAEVNNYFMMIKSELQIVWNALGDYLTGDHGNLDSGEPTSQSMVTSEDVGTFDDSHSSSVQTQAIDLIAFCLRDLHPNIAHYDDDRHDLQSIKEESLRNK